jgi:polyhydroxyalkanoate synthesis regulator phasin
MINDADRRKLFEALREAIGSEPSELLMELLPPTGWAHLATSADVAMVRTNIDIAKTELRIQVQDVRTELKGDIQRLDANIQDLRTELKGDIRRLDANIQDLRTELKGDIRRLDANIQDLRTELKGDIQEVRGEVQDLRGRIDGLVPKLVAANIASMIGIAGLVLGAVSIA